MHTVDLDPDLNLQARFLREILRCWESLARSGELPARDAFDPLMLPPGYWPRLALVDITASGDAALRYRWRLIGTHITETLGRDATGQYWEDIYAPEQLAAMVKSIAWVLANRRPIRVTGTAFFANKEYVAFESLEMPFASDGRTIDKIMMATTYGHSPAL